MTLTVNEVRRRLFKFADPIIRTKEFHEKYVLFSDCSMENRLNICEKNWDLTMAYIHAMASHLDFVGFATVATQAVPPEIILATYTVYWQVTQTLVHMDQDRKITVPDSDKDFFVYMFSDFLGESSEFTDT